MTDIITSLESLNEKVDAIAAAFAATTARWLTVEGAANHTNLSIESVRRLLASGKLTAHRAVRGRILIDKNELDNLIEASCGRPRKGRGMNRKVTIGDRRQIQIAGRNKNAAEPDPAKGRLNRKIERTHKG